MHSNCTFPRKMSIEFVSTANSKVELHDNRVATKKESGGEQRLISTPLLRRLPAG